MSIAKPTSQKGANAHEHYTILTFYYSISLSAKLLADKLDLQIYSSQAMVFFYIYKDFKPITKLPQTGIEPVREYKSRRILSPVRLPVPPLRHFVLSVYCKGHTCWTLSLLTYWYSGRWWIRTTEGFASRFTVCPIWPLGKSPLF